MFGNTTSSSQQGSGIFGNPAAAKSMFGGSQSSNPVSFSSPNAAGGISQQDAMNYKNLLRQMYQSTPQTAAVLAQKPDAIDKLVDRTTLKQLEENFRKVAEKYKVKNLWPGGGGGGLQAFGSGSGGGGGVFGNSNVFSGGGGSGPFGLQQPQNAMFSSNNGGAGSGGGGMNIFGLQGGGGGMDVFSQSAGNTGGNSSIFKNSNIGSGGPSFGQQQVRKSL
jgi:hypothetical protein